MKSLQSWGTAALLAGVGFAASGNLAHSGATSFDSTLKSGEPPHATTLAQTVGIVPPITTTSSASAIALAKHLKRVGARMYGAYWCPHCHDQLQVFGRVAAQQLTYIECAEDGKNNRLNLCKAAKIEGYPTWKIKGKTYEGTQTLEDLAKASGYKGSRNFK